MIMRNLIGMFQIVLNKIKNNIKHKLKKCITV